MTEISVVHLARGDERQVMERLDVAASLGCGIAANETEDLARLYSVLGHVEHVWTGVLNMPAFCELIGITEAELQRIWRMRRTVAFELSRRSDECEAKALALADWHIQSCGDDDWRRCST